jgi:hypothetical protein
MLTAYVPLQLVSDGGRENNVAFSGRMLYQATGLWQNAHNVRLVWTIQMLNDVCKTFEDDICSEYSAYNQLQVVQTYYDDWFLTGLTVTEDHSVDIALVYEDPAAVANEPDDFGAPLYLDTLYGLLYGLDRSFVAGRDCDSTDADEPVPASASATSRWTRLPGALTTRPTAASATRSAGACPMYSISWRITMRPPIWARWTAPSPVSGRPISRSHPPS